jgi:hypothetical protein
MLHSIRRDPSANALGRWLIRAMNSWWRTRWSAPPETRLARMFYAVLVVGALMLWFLLFGMPLRY